MGQLWTPRVIARPEIVDVGAAPDIACDIALVRDFGDRIRVSLCLERTPEGGVVDVVARLHMPKAGFRRSLLWVVADQIPGMTH